MSQNEATTTSSFRRLIRSDCYSRMENDLHKLLQSCSEYERPECLERNEGFLNLFERYLSIKETPFRWGDISPAPSSFAREYAELKIPRSEKIRTLLNKLIVVKLNGGLGTRMKCEGPKSLIPIRDSLTFLDLTVQQIINLNAEFDTNVPLVLMDSFRTSEDTERVLKKYNNFRVKIYTFMQDKYPRIEAETLKLLPSTVNDADQNSWYPPGHGNFYQSFYKSGLLHSFMEEGKGYCFISNIDNLGAVVDFRILDFMMNSEVEPEFLMEVIRKTPGDVEGGTLIHYRGKLKLLEYAQVPKDHLDDFKCTRKFNNFNTNNLWLKLSAVERLVKENNLSLDVIENEKWVDKDGVRLNIIQLETAAGAAVQAFDRPLGIFVPRSRFLPVKTTSDLFLLRSNVYINDNGKILMNPKRRLSKVPLITLSEEYFGNFRDLETRFQNIPDCLQLSHFTVSGDVHFGKNIILKGNVTIIANQGERIDIPSGSIFHYKIVTGSLRIVDF